MILNESRAFQIISNPQIVTQVPALARVYETYKAKEREFKPRKDCASCEQSDYFAGVRQQAVIAISQLDAASLVQLRKLLGETTIYTLIPVAGKEPSLKRLS